MITDLVGNYYVERLSSCKFEEGFTLFSYNCARFSSYEKIVTKKKILLLQAEVEDYALSLRYNRTRYKREQQFKQYNSIFFAPREKSILQRFNWSTRDIILFSLSTSISFERRM